MIHQSGGWMDFWWIKLSGQGVEQVGGTLVKFLFGNCIAKLDKKWHKYLYTLSKGDGTYFLY
jgi:hypothetical protein